MSTIQLEDFYKKSLEHKKIHGCGAVPYQHGDLLTTLVAATKSIRILEVGTGIGYSAACLLLGNNDAIIETIDKDSDHLKIAKECWKDSELSERIITHSELAEAVLPELNPEYDLIFLDGFVPQLKFLPHFERLLKKGGLLISANLFMSDKSGGRYVKLLKDERRWQTAIFEDTAISVRKP